MTRSGENARREGSLIDKLKARLASATREAERAQERLYEAYAAEGDPLGTGRDHHYRRMVGSLRAIVREHVPREATVLVVSRGDDDLIDLTVVMPGTFREQRTAGMPATTLTMGVRPSRSSRASTPLEPGFC